MSRARQPGQVAGYVKCPPSITGERWVKLWGDAQRQLRIQRTWRLTDVHMLERYVLAMRAQDHLQAAIDRDGATVDGSKRQTRVHPAYREITAQADLAMRLAKALRLSAEARVASRLDQADEGAGGTDDDQFGDL